MSDKTNTFSKHCLQMGNTVRGYKGAANGSTLFAEIMSAHFSAQQVIDLIHSDVQEEQENHLEEISEEEDGEEYNPDHDESSSDEEEIPQAERETFLAKNSQITWSSSPYDDQGRMAAQNVIRMTPGPTRHAVAHVQDIVSTFNLFITPAIERIVLEMTN